MIKDIELDLTLTPRAHTSAGGAPQEGDDEVTHMSL